jgi:hypothetical protein
VESSAAVEFSALLDRVRDHSFWGAYLSPIVTPQNPVGVHLAVFSEPFLSYVFSGRKTLESRFSRFRIAPFDAIAPGDVILIKEVAGPIRGVALAQQTWFFDLSSAPIRTLRERFAAGICADDSFWDDKRDAVFATIIELAEPASIEPLDCDKRDRRGWVTLRSRHSQLSLW